MTSYEEAKQEALDQDKAVLLYFWAPWCKWCDKYHENVFSDDRVDDSMDQFVKVAVDVDENSELTNEYGVRGPPTLIWVDPGTGEVIHKLEGYPSPERVSDPAGAVSELLDDVAASYNSAS